MVTFKNTMELICLSQPKQVVTDLSTVKRRLENLKTMMMKPESTLIPLDDFLLITNSLREIIVELRDIHTTSIVYQGIRSYTMDKRIHELDDRILHLREMIEPYIS